MNNEDKLLEKSRRYEQDLTEQIGDLSGKAQRVGKSALMIAGGVFLAYQTVRLLTGSKKSRNTKVYKETYEDDNEYEDSPRIIIRREADNSSSILNTLKAEVGGILVAIARDKILEFISKLETQKSNDREEDV